VGLGLSFRTDSQSARKAGFPRIDNGDHMKEVKFIGRTRLVKSFRTRKQIPRGRCPIPCECRCHRSLIHPLPQSFLRAFRQLFPTVLDNPVLVRNCTKLDCRAMRTQQLRIFVVVHAAFVSRAIVLAAISRGLRLKLQIKSYPVVPETSAIVHAAETGNLELMDRLISGGKATVNDISEDGWSLLHVSTNLTHSYLLSKAYTFADLNIPWAGKSC
jgi:hypothetical protein